MSLTYQSGYLTSKEANIWFLRKKKSNQSEIARILNVSRQAIHKTLLRIDDKIKHALIDAAETNKLEIKKIDPINGLMKAYSPAQKVQAIISLTKANGIKIWYMYKVNCMECTHYTTCKNMLISEAKERGIQINDNLVVPTDLALDIFSKYFEELE